MNFNSNHLILKNELVELTKIFRIFLKNIMSNSKIKAYDKNIL